MATSRLRGRDQKLPAAENLISSNKLPRALLATALFASMGPYLGSGLRTEQIAVYASVILLIPVLARSKYDTGLGAPTAAWAALATVNATVSFMEPPVENAVLLAGLDAVFLPLAAMCLALYASQSINLRNHLLMVQRATVMLLCANSILSLAMLLWPQIALFMEGLFWSVDDAREESNALLVYGLGRVLGVFHSPFGAGIAYSAAIALAIYLIRTGNMSARVSVVALPLLFAGGVLTQSKVVYFVGLPCAVLLYLLLGRAKRSGFAILVASVVGLFGVSTLADEWKSQFVSRWLELFQSSDDILDLFTAGRISENSAVRIVRETALHESPVYGLGARGAQLGALDTTWTEAIVRTGLFGLTCVVLMVLIIITRSLGSYSRTKSPEAALGIALSIVLVAAMFGGPTLTMNRVGTIIVLNLWLLLAVLHRDRTEGNEAANRASQ